MALRAAALERLGQQIHEVAEALARRMYNLAATPNAMPERLTRLRGEIAAHEELEVSLGTQLALLDERLRQGAGDVSAREGQQALRHKLSEAQERALLLRRELGQLLIGQPDARGHDAERQPLELLLARPNVAHFPDFVAPLRRPCPAVVTIHDLAFMHYPEILDDSARAYYGQVRTNAPRAISSRAISALTTFGCESRV